jgi:hypothetical protein
MLLPPLWCGGQRHARMDIWRETSFHATSAPGHLQATKPQSTSAEINSNSTPRSCARKRMRLHMARVRMLTEGLDAASAAFEVGYESPTQFNREYRRLFGLPPMRDIKARQLVEVEQNRN